MKPSYAPDNTRSSILVILLLAAGIAVVAVLIGLSDKPSVAAIGVSVSPAEVEAAATNVEPLGSTTAPATFGLDTDSDTDATASASATGQIEFDESGQPILDGAAETPAEGAGLTVTTEDETGSTTIVATPIPIPTSTVAPTPEVAAAVEPDPADTAAADDTATADLDAELDASLAPSAAVNPGTIAGRFFTRPDEDDGATVARNELTLTLNADGTGQFAGVLDMTLADGTHIVLGMSGPVRWSSESPQVSAELTGSYSLDSPIDAEDIESTDAELTVSSLGSGSGSLCTPTCYGFTFPQQTGF